MEAFGEPCRYCLTVVVSLMQSFTRSEQSVKFFQRFFHVKERLYGSSGQRRSSPVKVYEQRPLLRTTGNLGQQTNKAEQNG